MNESTLAKKKELVEVIADKISNSSSSIVVEYRGLTVAEVTELRRKLRSENIDFKVYKNSIVEFAVKKLGHDSLLESLKGPNAFAFSEDAVAPSRVLAEFAKKHKKLILKSGIVDGKVVLEEEIKQLAKLPNKEGMISMVLGCIQSPIRSVALAVKAVAESKE